MKVNVINGKDQIIDTIDADELYLTVDYVADCLSNGVWDDATLDQFNNDIAGMAFQDPETEDIVDWLVRSEEVELRKIFLKRKGK